MIWRFVISYKNQKTILLVEDEALIGMMESRQLEKAGYTVITTTTGEEAIDIVCIKGKPVDLILMDIDLGRGIDGTMASVEILKHHDIPILFLSSHIEEDIVNKTENISSYGYVVKNSSFTVLDASIKMAFRLYEANTRIQSQRTDIEAAYEKMRNAYDELENNNNRLVASEKALRDRELYLSAVAKATQDGYWVLDKDYGVVDVNETFCIMSGYARSDLLRLRITDLAVPGSTDGMKTRMTLAVENGSDLFEARLQGRDGEIYDVEISVTWLGGDICQFVCFCRDITERKKSEAALLESEEKFLKTFQSTPDFILLTSIPEGKIIAVNDSALRITGYTPEELVGRTTRDLSLWVDLVAREKYMALVKKEGRVYNFETTFRPKSGVIITALLSGTIISLKSGLCFITVVHDITERKQMEETLKGSERAIRAVFDSTFQFTGMMTPEGILLDANGTALGYIGARLEDVVNRPFWDTPWWRGDAQRIRRLKEAIAEASSGKFVRYEEELRGTGDSALMFDFSIKPVLGPDGSIRLLIPEARDISGLNHLHKPL